MNLEATLIQVTPQAQEHLQEETHTVLVQIAIERLVVLQVEACRHLSEPKSEMKRVRL